MGSWFSSPNGEGAGAGSGYLRYVRRAAVSKQFAARLQQLKDSGRLVDPNTQESVLLCLPCYSLQFMYFQSMWPLIVWSQQFPFYFVYLFSLFCLTTEERTPTAFVNSPTGPSDITTPTTRYAAYLPTSVLAYRHSLLT